MATRKGDFSEILLRRRLISQEQLVEARQQIGNEKRILALNNDTSVGAVPGRPIESEINYGYRNWHLMAFGAPDVAKAAFQKEGINYFILRRGAKK